MNAQTGKVTGGALALHKGKNTAEAGEEQRGRPGEGKPGWAASRLDLLDGQVGGSERSPAVEAVALLLRIVTVSTGCSTCSAVVPDVEGGD